MKKRRQQRRHIRQQSCIVKGKEGNKKKALFLIQFNFYREKRHVLKQEKNKIKIMNQTINNKET